MILQNKPKNKPKSPSKLTKKQKELVERRNKFADSVNRSAALGNNTRDVTPLPEIYHRFIEKGYITHDTPLKDVRRRILERQTGWDIFEASYKGFFGLVGAALVDQLGTFDLTGLKDIVFNNTKENYSNYFYRKAQRMREEINNKYHIVDDGSGSMWTPEYFGMQFQQLGYSAGIAAFGLLEGFAVTAATAGMGALTGASRVAKMAKYIKKAEEISKKAKAAKSAGKVEESKRLYKLAKEYSKEALASQSKVRQGVSTAIGFGISSSTRETYLNSIHTGQEVYERFKEEGYGEEKAREKANEAASLNFKNEFISNMVLNTIQFANVGKYNPLFTLKPRFGVSGAVEGVLDNVLKKRIPNKLARGATRFGVALASGSLEEASQSYISKYAANQILSQNESLDFPGQPIEREKGFSELITEDNQIRDEAVGGAIGEALFFLLGSGSSRAMKILRNNRYKSSVYKSMIEQATKDAVELQDAIKERHKEGGEERVEEIKKRINRDNVYSAFLLDLQDDNKEDVNFNGYIESLKSKLKEIENSDVDKMIEDGYTKEDIKYIKELYPQFITEAEEIFKRLKEGYQKDKNFDFVINKLNREDQGKLINNLLEKLIGETKELREKFKDKELLDIIYNIVYHREITNNKEELIKAWMELQKYSEEDIKSIRENPEYENYLRKMLDLDYVNKEKKINEKKLKEYNSSKRIEIFNNDVIKWDIDQIDNIEDLDKKIESLKESDSLNEEINKYIEERRNKIQESLANKEEERKEEERKEEERKEEYTEDKIEKIDNAKNITELEEIEENITYTLGDVKRIKEKIKEKRKSLILPLEKYLEQKQKEVSDKFKKAKKNKEKDYKEYYRSLVAHYAAKTIRDGKYSYNLRAFKKRIEEEDRAYAEIDFKTKLIDNLAQMKMDQIDFSDDPTIQELMKKYDDEIISELKEITGIDNEVFNKPYKSKGKDSGRKVTTSNIKLSYSATKPSGKSPESKKYKISFDQLGLPNRFLRGTTLGVKLIKDEKVKNLKEGSEEYLDAVHIQVTYKNRKGEVYSVAALHHPKWYDDSTNFPENSGELQREGKEKLRALRRLAYEYSKEGKTLELEVSEKGGGLFEVFRNNESKTLAEARAKKDIELVIAVETETGGIKLLSSEGKDLMTSSEKDIEPLLDRDGNPISLENGHIYELVDRGNGKYTLLRVVPKLISEEIIKHLYSKIETYVSLGEKGDSLSLKNELSKYIYLYNLETDKDKIEHAIKDYEEAGEEGINGILALVNNNKFYKEGKSFFYITEEGDIVFGRKYDEKNKDGSINILKKGEESKEKLEQIKELLQDRNPETGVKVNIKLSSLSLTSRERLLLNGNKVLPFIYYLHNLDTNVKSLQVIDKESEGKDGYTDKEKVRNTKDVIFVQHVITVEPKGELEKTLYEEFLKEYKGKDEGKEGIKETVREVEETKETIEEGEKTKETVGETKQTTEETKQTTEETKETVGETKQTTEETKETVGETKQTTEETKQTTEETKQTTEETKEQKSELEELLDQANTYIDNLVYNLTDKGTTNVSAKRREDIVGLGNLSPMQNSEIINYLYHVALIKSKFNKKGEILLGDLIDTLDNIYLNKLRNFVISKLGILKIKQKNIREQISKSKGKEKEKLQAEIDSLEEFITELSGFYEGKIKLSDIKNPKAKKVAEVLEILYDEFNRKVLIKDVIKILIKEAKIKGVSNKKIDKALKGDINDRKSTLKGIFSEKEHSYDVSSREINPKSGISFRLKLFLSGIPELDREGNRKQGIMGVDLYMDPDKVFDALMQTLAGKTESNVDEIMLALENSNLAWKKDLIDELNRKNDKNEDINAGIKREMAEIFSQYPSNDFYLAIEENVDGTDFKVVRVNIKDVQSMLLRRWRANFKREHPIFKSDENGILTIDKKVYEKILKQYEKLKNTNIDDLENVDVINWLRNFGIEVSYKTIEDIKKLYKMSSEKKEKNQFTIKQKKNLFENKNQIFMYLKEALDKMVLDVEKNKDEIIDIDKLSFNIHNHVKSGLRKLATIQAEHSEVDNPTMYIDDNKKIYTFIKVTLGTNIARRLQDKGYIEKYLYNSKGERRAFNSASHILNDLYNDDNIRKNFSINYTPITVLRSLNRFNKTETEFQKMSRNDMELYKLGLFTSLKYKEINSKHMIAYKRLSTILFPAFSSKHQMLTMRAPVFNFWLDIDIVNNTKGERIKDTVYEQLILPELKRIVEVREDLENDSTDSKEISAKDVTGYKDAGKTFIFFPQLNALIKGKVLMILKKYYKMILNLKRML